MTSVEKISGLENQPCSVGLYLCWLALQGHADSPSRLGGPACIDPVSVVL